MKMNIEPLLSWFGHTRRERRASFILLIIIVIIVSFRFVIPRKEIVVEDVSELYSDMSEADTAVRVPVAPSRALMIQKEVNQVKVDLNSCDSLALMRLPGIGQVLSVRIIKYRNKLGGFLTVEQLREVYGLPEETFDKIKSRVFADTSRIRKVRINEGGFRELGRIPYIEKYEISAILKYRQLSGRVAGIAVLVDNKVLSGEKASKIRGYLDFR
jgi:competence ComEA-like helix-hairpin-helix protein